MKITWQDVGNTVAAAAPWVGSLLGGPAGAAVGKVVAEVLGTEPTPDAVAAELAKNPEAFTKIREAEITQQTRFRELDTEEYKASLVDRQSARERQVKLAESGNTDHTQEVLALVAVVGFFAALYVLFFYEMKDGAQRDVLILLIGALSVTFKDVFGYYFGSSKGSQGKDQTITTLARGK